ncbi:MAG: D-alanine--D-alanine ligase family protein [Patescibacteria group bacterium]
MKITIIYSLPTKRALTTPYLATEEDTRESALEVAEALKSRGVEVAVVGIAEDNLNAIKKIRADCIFNLIEWTGLDLPLSVAVFKYLEGLGTPFTGATSGNFALTSDKVKMKEALDLAGLPTPRWQLFSSGDEALRSDLRFPVIAKLAWEHCSIGLTRDAVTRDPVALKNLIIERLNVFKQPVYIEEFIAGREFQVTLLEREDGLFIFPIAEIVFTKANDYTFLTYSGRWDEDHPEFAATRVVVADIPSSLKEKICELARTIFTKFNFRDYARLDLRCRGEEVFILEANSNPGLGDSEEYSMTVSYKAVGLTFADFIWEIVTSCLRRFHQFSAKSV